MTSPFRDAPRDRVCAITCAEQVGEVVDYQVGAGGAQLGGLSGPVDADDETEATRASGGYAGQRIPEHRSLSRLDAEAPRRLQEDVGRGLPREAELVRDRAVDLDVEGIAETRRPQHGSGVLAQGDDRAAEPHLPHRRQEARTDPS